ncbi:MAG TPA: NAD(P)/FAD-dependent oxidoreductase [Burkholderiaceae bacterium]|nr:NAD(P)/FAD-dependent oxidoreductase [Burkholderiaceae bacterium]
MEKVDCVVIGAGVIGLAVARALARVGRDVLILERARAIGTETSSRNSEVIHAGIYYPAQLAKARWCVAGKEMLYRFCADCGVAHRRCGKLIVATDDSQRPQLAALLRQAQENGVHDLAWLTPAQVSEMEPHVRCKAALLSRSSGIIDSHAYMLALLGDAERHDAWLAFGSAVTGGRITEDGIELDVAGDEPMTLRAAIVVNSAGLRAQQVARAIGMPAQTVPPAFFAKGNYYTLGGRSPFTRLVYPLPEPGGLGVHVTLDLGGQIRFGPDVEWLDGDPQGADGEFDYTVDPRRADRFYAAIRKYWPGLPDAALRPGYAGIRPKIERPGGSTTDFLVQGPRAHGVPGLVHLYGIESPGITASLALAEHVVELLR